MTDNLVFHPAEDIKQDIDSNQVDRAAAKLYEDFKADPSRAKSEAKKLEELTRKDKDWNNDVEITRDAKGEVKEIFIKTVPFTGTFFATKMYDKADDFDKADPIKDLAQWSRAMHYKNLRASEQ